LTIFAPAPPPLVLAEAAAAAVFALAPLPLVLADATAAAVFAPAPLTLVLADAATAAGTISVRAMMKIGHAAVHHESAMVRHVCFACYAMGLRDIRIDQLNTTCILGEHSPSGCLQCHTDLDKDGACCPCYIHWLASMVARGLTASSAPRLMSQLQGFLLKEDDSTNGDPFLASKIQTAPKKEVAVSLNAYEKS